MNDNTRFKPLWSRRRICVGLLGAAFAHPLHAYEATSPRKSSLIGTWVLNPELSEDAEALLQERLAKERKRYARMMRDLERSGDLPPIGEERVQPSEQARERMRRRREQQLQRYRQMLAISNFLRIREVDGRLEFATSVETRRFEPGTRTQVSMPEGELADSEVGWDGQWFVISRRTRRGPRVIEKFRVLKGDQQLEYRMSWSGDTELAGIDVRRIYDRGTIETIPRLPDL